MPRTIHISTNGTWNVRLEDNIHINAPENWLQIVPSHGTAGKGQEVTFSINCPNIASTGICSSTVYFEIEEDASKKHKIVVTARVGTFTTIVINNVQRDMSDKTYEMSLSVGNGVIYVPLNDIKPDANGVYTKDLTGLYDFSQAKNVKDGCYVVNPLNTIQDISPINSGECAIIKHEDSFSNVKFSTTLRDVININIYGNNNLLIKSDYTFETCTYTYTYVPPVETFLINPVMTTIEVTNECLYTSDITDNKLTIVLEGVRNYGLKNDVDVHLNISYDMTNVYEYRYTTTDGQKINVDGNSSYVLGHTYENGVGRINYYSPNGDSPRLLNNQNLNTIMVPDGVKNIVVNCFNKCSSLISISVPNSIESWGDFSIRACNLLEYIIYRGTKNEWINNVTVPGSSDRWCQYFRTGIIAGLQENLYVRCNDGVLQYDVKTGLLQ